MECDGGSVLAEEQLLCVCVRIASLDECGDTHCEEGFFFLLTFKSQRRFLFLLLFRVGASHQGPGCAASNALHKRPGGVRG